MNESKEDLLLHPVRLRLILSVAGRRVTAQQLTRELPDVPQASLYRNIRKLVSAGILEVVEERLVRNTMERTFALPNANLLLTAEEVANASPKEHLRLFTRFLGLLLGYFSRYVHSARVDVVRDHMMYRMFAMYLSDAEVGRLGRDLNEVFSRHAGKGAGGARRRFVIGIVSMPDGGDPPQLASKVNGGISQ